MKLKNILAIILLLSLSKTIVAQTNKEEKDTTYEPRKHTGERFMYPLAIISSCERPS
jgi:hypothetical protein